VSIQILSTPGHAPTKLNEECHHIKVIKFTQFITASRCDQRFAQVSKTDSLFGLGALGIKKGTESKIPHQNVQAALMISTCILLDIDKKLPTSVVTWAHWMVLL
jgi:hypothetical protein